MLTDEKPNMPKPPPDMFFRITMSSILGVPVMWVQLRKKTFIGSVRINRMYHDIDPGDNLAAEAESMGLELLKRFLQNKMSWAQHKHGVTKLEGDYRR